MSPLWYGLYTLKKADMAKKLLKSFCLDLRDVVTYTVLSIAQERCFAQKRYRNVFTLFCYPTLPCYTMTTPEASISL